MSDSVGTNFYQWTISQLNDFVPSLLDEPRPQEKLRRHSHLDWIATLTTHIPKKGEQLIRY